MKWAGRLCFAEWDFLSPLTRGFETPFVFGAPFSVELAILRRRSARSEGDRERRTELSRDRVERVSRGGHAASRQGEKSRRVEIVFNKSLQEV